MFMESEGVEASGDYRPSLNGNEESCKNPLELHPDGE